MLTSFSLIHWLSVYLARQHDEALMGDLDETVKRHDDAVKLKKTQRENYANAIVRFRALPPTDPLRVELESREKVIQEKVQAAYDAQRAAKRLRLELDKTDADWTKLDVVRQAVAAYKRTLDQLHESDQQYFQWKLSQHLVPPEQLPPAPVPLHVQEEERRAKNYRKLRAVAASLPDDIATTKFDCEADALVWLLQHPKYPDWEADSALYADLAFHTQTPEDSWSAIPKETTTEGTTP